MEAKPVTQRRRAVGTARARLPRDPRAFKDRVGRIAGVAVSTDGRASWQEARREGPVLPLLLHPLPPTLAPGGRASTTPRPGRDETGYIEPSREALVAVHRTRSFWYDDAVFAWSAGAGRAVTHAA